MRASRHMTGACLLVTILTITVLIAPATAQDDGPSRLALTSAEHYVEQLEFEADTAHGEPFNLKRFGSEALKRVKALVQKYPDHPKVKELFERMKICVKKSRGSYFEITEEMLAYRKLEKLLVEKLGETADQEWERYSTRLKASSRYLPAPFPVPDPGEGDSDAEMSFRQVILKDFEFPAREFTNSGRQYVAVGSVTQGLYYVDLSSRRWVGAYEALKRYRREAAGTIPASWTIVGTIEEVKAADMEARMKAVDVDLKHEKTLLSLEREDRNAHVQLGKAGTDKQQEQSAWKEIRRVEARMIAEERAVQKEKRYWLEDWFTEQEESAFDKREEAVKKYKAKLKELNGELPK